MIAAVPVPRLWPGQTVVCIASGPSLTEADVQAVRGKARVIVINTSYRLVPWAEVLYACDAKWWNWEQGAPRFAGMKYGLQKMRRYPDVGILRRGPELGLSLDPSIVSHGRNSGYQAINLAVHFGASRILLLGYDMGYPKGSRSHWFGEHPSKQRGPYASFIPMFSTLVDPLRRAGVTVVNCSRATALTCFPVMPLEDALREAVAA